MLKNNLALMSYWCISFYGYDKCSVVVIDAVTYKHNYKKYFRYSTEMHHLTTQVRELEGEKIKWENEAKDFSKANTKYLKVKQEKEQLEVKHAELSSEYSSMQFLVKDREGELRKLTKR